MRHHRDARRQALCARNPEDTGPHPPGEVHRPWRGRKVLDQEKQQGEHQNQVCKVSGQALRPGIQVRQRQVLLLGTCLRHLPEATGHRTCRTQAGQGLSNPLHRPPSQTQARHEAPWHQQGAICHRPRGHLQLRVSGECRLTPNRSLDCSALMKHSLLSSVLKVRTAREYEGERKQTVEL